MIVFFFVVSTLLCMYMHHMVSYGMCNAVRILQSLLYMHAISIKSMMQLLRNFFAC